MRVMDNSPIDVPAVGRLVKEQYAVGQFADCCLYALPSNTGAMVEKAKEVFNGWIKTMGAEKLLNKYDFEELGKMPVLDNHPTLSMAIDDEKCQFLMPIYAPSQEEKQYLLLKTEEDKLYNDIAMMLYTSERISKHSMNELLKEFALDAPEQFCDGLKEIAESEKFWKNYFVSLANDVFHPTFGMRASEPKIKEVLKIDGIITHQKKSEMIDRMMDNITSYRKSKDEKAEAELTYVLSTLDIESLKKFLTKMSKKQLETFFKTANPKVLAEESTMKLEIRYEGKIDPVRKADGKYRLYLCKQNYKDVQVHFGRREAFILYLIYMIDKHERDTVDTLKIESYKTHFKNLFETVYGKDDAEKRFDRMVSHTDGKGNPQQAQIKHCYSDIRMAVSDGCEKLRELPAPFILADAKDHLYAQKSKISVPKVLIDMMK